MLAFVTSSNVDVMPDPRKLHVCLGGGGKNLPWGKMSIVSKHSTFKLVDCYHTIDFNDDCFKAVSLVCQMLMSNLLEIECS